MRGLSVKGDRQYLTGLKVGGDRILLMVDVSAGMLDETVVSVLRMRSSSDASSWCRKVASLGVDGGMARGADAAGRPVPDLRLQR